jgi:hypothetical protein
MGRINDDILSPYEPKEYYECTCGLQFKYFEGAAEHLKETFEHSVYRVLNTLEFDVNKHYPKDSILT